MASKVSLEVVNFKKEMERVKREVRDIANSDIDKRVDYAVKTLGLVTPVDTGEARSGWTYKNSVGLDGYRDTVILNEVEHVVYLNRGHSQQAPKYFIEQVLTTIGLITP